MIKYDSHMHSYHSFDSKEPMENMVLKGIELGLKGICFTEHQDIDFNDPHEEPGAFSLNADAYLYELLMLRNKYEGKINISFGVEMGFQPHLRRELALYAKAYDFDFIIGSMHLLGGLDPAFPDYYDDKNDEDVYRAYFKEMQEGLKVFSNFDVLGHLDYIVRYGKTKDANYSYDKYKDLIDPILEKLVDNGKGIEVNTGAIRHGLKDLNPTRDIVKKYRELGGEIVTVGSDAHNINYLASGFDVAEQFLLDCGFKYYTSFEKRVAEFHKLG